MQIVEQFGITGKEGKWDVARKKLIISAVYYLIKDRRIFNVTTQVDYVKTNTKTKSN